MAKIKKANGFTKIKCILILILLKTKYSKHKENQSSVNDKKLKNIRTLLEKMILTFLRQLAFQFLEFFF